jgi:hypothetical protein
MRMFTVGTALSIVLSMVLSFLVFVPISAGAADSYGKGYGEGAQEQWSQPGYANEMMSGNSSNRGGWSTDIYSEITDANTGSDSEDFIAKINDISNKLSTDLLVTVIILSSLRFAARGVFEMMFRQKNNTMESEFLDKNSFILGFITTGDERKGQKLNSAWVVPMLKSTIKIWVIVIAIWVIFRIIAGIVLFALGSLQDPEGAWQSGTQSDSGRNLG